jgi:hypothetical protein
MQARVERVIEWSTPPDEERALIEWLSGSPDPIPNQIGLVMENARDLLGAYQMVDLDQFVSSVREAYALLDASDAFEDLLRFALDGVGRVDADLVRARASIHERAEAALV